MPQADDPLIDLHPLDNVRERMAIMRARIRQAAESMPTHEAFLADPRAA